MLKRLFIALAGMVLALPAAAQYNSGSFEANEASIYYGVRMGVGSNWLCGGGNSSSQVGMNLGGVLGMRVVKSEAVFLESGLYYAQRGGKGDMGKVHLNYLELPVLIKGGFAVTNDFILLPFIGPYFACGISGQSTHSDGDGHEVKISSYDDFKRFDMGFKLGCGAEYSLFYLELGFQFGVQDISKSEQTARNRSLYANFGINF